jgi:alpha-beta hydrolase superfamily lysophospholipase
MLFGESTRALYGVYHEPAFESRDEAILLCNPLCHEYMKTHWAFRRLAMAVASAGFPALRFDYYGCGDSAGNAGDGSLAEWRRNIRTAAEELIALSGATAVTLVGLRIGAALAIEAVAEGLPVRDLVLWNPVVRGAQLLRELGEQEAENARWHAVGRRPGRGAAARDEQGRAEVLGFPLPERMRREMESIDLIAIARRVRARTVIMALSDQKGEYLQLQDALGHAGMAVKYQMVADSGNWEELFAWGGRLLATTMPQAIADILSGGRS